MKVWFGATSLKIEQNITNYRLINRYLKKKGCIVLFDWIEDAYRYKIANPQGERKIKNVYQQVLTAIDEADITIIEYTIPNFSSSHQIIYSIHKRKPTLVLRQKRDNSFADSYIEAIESNHLTIRDYNLKNYGEIISQFIGESSIEQGMGRYNIVLENRQKYYLDWASVVYRKSRSETIRNALEWLISKDENYRKYLGEGNGNE